MGPHKPTPCTSTRASALRSGGQRSSHRRRWWSRSRLGLGDMASPKRPLFPIARAIGRSRARPDEVSGTPLLDAVRGWTVGSLQQSRRVSPRARVAGLGPNRDLGRFRRLPHIRRPRRHGDGPLQEHDALTPGCCNFGDALRRNSSPCGAWRPRQARHWHRSTACR